MKGFSLVIVGILAMALAASGCVSISKYTPPGATPAVEEEKPVSQGKIGKVEPKVKIEVELLERPDFSRFYAPKTADNEVAGNRGNFAGGRLTPGREYKPVIEPARKEEPKVWWPIMPEEKPAQPMAEPAPQPRPAQTEEKAKPAVTKYKVQKGQTLGDVSREVYGTTKKWRKIYEANKGKIKDPDKIYAGQVLDIPQEETVKHLK